MGWLNFHGILRYALPAIVVRMIAVFRVRWLDMVNVIFGKVLNQFMKLFVRMAFNIIIILEPWLPVFVVSLAVMGLISVVIIPS